MVTINPKYFTASKTENNMQVRNSKRQILTTSNITPRRGRRSRNGSLTGLRF